MATRKNTATTKPKRAVAPAAKRAKPPVEKSVRSAEGGLPSALLNRFIDADLLSQAGALAFSAVLSLAPLMLLLLWLVSTLMPSAQQALVDQIGTLVGGEAQRIAQSIVSASKAGPDTRSIAGWWSLLGLFIGATAVFAQLQEALNKIFRTDATHLPGIAAWLKKRIFSFGLVFAVGFLLLISLTVTTVLQLAFARADWLLPVVAMFAAWLVYALGFALMYQYMPDRRVGWRRAIGGGAMTSALFLAGRSLIGWYLHVAGPSSAYGSMGALAIALLWMYYACLVVFLGALVTAVLDERKPRS